MATASTPAKAAANLIASIMLAAISIVRSVNPTPPNSGSITHSTSRCQVPISSSPSLSPLPGEPFGALLLAYQSLFQASSSEALKKLARDERLIGTDRPGFTGILPTWGRQLQYPPHIHYLVPGGGLAKQRDQWRPSNSQFDVPVRALWPISRALFKAQSLQAGYLDAIEPRVWNPSWKVHSQATPGATTSLKYLAPYVFKGAISNRRLVSLKDRIVTFTFRKPGSHRPRTIRLEVIEVIRRFLLLCG